MQFYAGHSDIQLINTDVGDLDIAEERGASKGFREHKADIIINCAAYTKVDDCEKNQELAYRINVVGVRKS